MEKRKKAFRRKIRIKKKIRGSTSQPRLRVFRSNRYVYAQLIDDEKGSTIVGMSEMHIKDGKESEKETKTQKARKLGIAIAEKAKEKKVQKVVFDRGSYAYHGRIKAVAEGAREGGLQF